MDRPAPLTRDELLGGLAGRRISATLYAVESRTAYLALRARQATLPPISEPSAERRERAFLAALAGGRDLPVSPSAQELERFAPQWSPLVADDAVVRAELAHRLGDKHRFRREDVPRIRAALRLDDDSVSAAYRRRHGRPLDAIYAEHLPWRGRLRWRMARLAGWLEELPPFSASYALTLTETVGAGVLALPIAVANVGPLPGVALIAVIGLVNVLTVAAVAEAFARTGEVRWGGAFFGRLVTGYLGRRAGGVFTVSLVLIGIVALLAYYVGLSTTMAHTTPVPAPVWAAALFAVGLAFALRRRLDATVATALLVGAVNLLAVVVLAGLAIAHMDADNLRHVAVPFVGGRPFDPGTVGLVFGVVLIAFFGHTTVGICARTVLSRDPGGRSLIRGAACAMITTVALYAVWVFAVGGAVDPGRLARESGTVLTPLADVAGPGVVVVGTVFVILAMGMASVTFTVGLFDLAADVLRGRRRLSAFGGLIPVGGVFLAVELLLVTHRESFAGPLSLIGTVTAPLIAGIFPVLLLLAGRRRGDYVPDRVSRLLGSVPVAAIIFAIFFAALLAHGLVIWQAWPQRAVALAVAGVVVAVTADIWRSDALVPLATVELRRQRESGQDVLQVTAHGQPVTVPVQARVRGGGEVDLEVTGATDLPPGLVSARVDLRSVTTPQLRVWAHQVDGAGTSQPLPAGVTLTGADADRSPTPVDQPAVPFAASPGEVEIVLDGPQARRIELGGLA